MTPTFHLKIQARNLGVIYLYHFLISPCFIYSITRSLILTSKESLYPSLLPVLTAATWSGALPSLTFSFPAVLCSILSPDGCLKLLILSSHPPFQNSTDGFFVYFTWSFMTSLLPACLASCFITLLIAKIIFTYIVGISWLGPVVKTGALTGEGLGSIHGQGAVWCGQKKKKSHTRMRIFPSKWSICSSEHVVQ